MVGDEYLQSQEILNKNANKRKTKNSSDKTSERNKSNSKKAKSGTRHVTRSEVT